MSAIFYKNLPYGAGGSNVEANPSGSATDDLEKIGIDGTVYDVTDADAVHNADKGVANGVASLDANGRVNETANYARTAGMASQGTFTFTPQNTDYDGSVTLNFIGTSQQFAPQELLQVPYKSGTLATTGDIKDGTLTIQRNGIDVQTFSANESSDKTVNIECAVPTDIVAAKNDLTAIAEKTDTDPYIYRPSVANGDRVREDIVGASVGWNQLVQNGDFADTSVWGNNGVTFSVSNNVGTITYSGSADKYVWQSFSMIIGHKYFYTVTGYSNNAHTEARDGGFELYVGEATTRKREVFTTIKTTYSGIANVDSNRFNFLRLYSSNGNTSYYSNIMFIDLTQLFGTTIADHIYSLEQATAGAGVAFFRKYFPNAYYPYNAGELLSVEVEGKKYVGKNLINLANSEQGGIDGTGALVAGGNMWRGTEFIKVVPNKKVTFSALSGYVDSFRIYYYDQNKNYIGRELDTYTYTIPSDCAYIKWVIYHVAPYTFTQALVNSINLQLEYGENPTTYEPYHLTTYTFQSQTLRGLFTLVDGELKASGDVYGDSVVIKRDYAIGVINSTSQLNTPSSSDTGAYCVVNTMTDAKAGGYPVSDKAIGIYFADRNTYQAEPRVYIDGNGRINLRAANTKTSATKEEMLAIFQGCTIVYPLATPTTEQAEPLVMPQICDKNGTEEFITTSIVPVGHESTYYNYPDYMESGEYKDFRDRVDSPVGKLSVVTHHNEFVWIEPDNTRNLYLWNSTVKPNWIPISAYVNGYKCSVVSKNDTTNYNWLVLIHNFDGSQATDLDFGDNVDVQVVYMSI